MIRVRLEDNVRFNYRNHPLEENESLGGVVIEVVDFGSRFKVDLKRYVGSEVKESLGKTYIEYDLVENLRVVKK